MMSPPLPPEILAQLLRAFQAAQAQQGPMQPMPAAPMAPGIGAPNPGFSPAPPAQGFALAPAEGPLGENAQLGWGTAPPMQYPSPTSGIGTAVTYEMKPKPRKPAPQRRGAGDFPGRPLHPSQNTAGNASAPGRPPDRGPVRSGPTGSHVIHALMHGKRAANFPHYSDAQISRRMGTKRVYY